MHKLHETAPLFYSSKKRRKRQKGQYSRFQ